MDLVDLRVEGRPLARLLAPLRLQLGDPLRDFGGETFLPRVQGGKGLALVVRDVRVERRDLPLQPDLGALHPGEALLRAANRRFRVADLLLQDADRVGVHDRLADFVRAPLEGRQQVLEYAHDCLFASIRFRLISLVPDPAASGRPRQASRCSTASSTSMVFSACTSSSCAMTSKRVSSAIAPNRM